MRTTGLPHMEQSVYDAFSHQVDVGLLDDRAAIIAYGIAWYAITITTVQCAM
jgi:hypothetical protein